MTTVRLTEEDDVLLERLRAKYILLGNKMTKKEILGHLIRKEARKYEEFVQLRLLFFLFETFVMKGERCHVVKNNDSRCSHFRKSPLQDP